MLICIQNSSRHLIIERRAVRACRQKSYGPCYRDGGLRFITYDSKVFCWKAFNVGASTTVLHQLTLKEHRKHHTNCEPQPAMCRFAHVRWERFANGNRLPGTLFSVQLVSNIVVGGQFGRQTAEAKQTKLIYKPNQWNLLIHSRSADEIAEEASRMATDHLQMEIRTDNSDNSTEIGRDNLQLRV